MKLKFLYNPANFAGSVKCNLSVVVKLTAILIFVGVLQLSAATFAQGITISKKNVNLETVFKDIKRQTGYTFFYPEKVNTTDQKLNVDLKNATLKEALDYCLKGLNLSYTIVDKTIVIRLLPAGSKAAIPAKSPDQLLEIKGKVVDAKTKETIPGVSIYLKSIKTAPLGITDDKGDFIVHAELGDVLVFTFIGYKPKEVGVMDSKPLTVKLETQVETMNETVINGYQTLKKESYTGSAITVSGEELKRNNPANVIKAIASFDPSIRIGDNNLTGSDPNALPKLTFRGSTALPSVDGSIVDRNNLSSTYNLPAFMLDGFPATLEQIVDLDIDRIASVTILKDAAATAVYGSRAANGVIVVTTKVPKPGKLQLTYNAQLNIQAPDLSSYHVLNAAQKLQYEKLAGLYTTNPAVSNASQYDLDQQYNKILKNVVSGVNTYWLSQPLQNAFGMKHSLDAQGGDSTFRYDINGRYQTSPGVMIGSSRNDYSGGMTFYYNPSKKLLFRNQLTITQEESTNSPYGNFSTYVAMNPYYPITDANGNSLRELANWTVANPSKASGASEYISENVNNPLFEAHVGSFSKSAYFQVLDNFAMDYYITNALKLSTQFGLTDTKNTSDQFVSPLSNTFYYGPTSQINNRGSYTYNVDNELTYDGQVKLTYNKQFGGHSVNFLLLSEIGNDTNDQKGFTAVGFSNATFTNIGFARSYALNSSPLGDWITSRFNNNSLTGNYTYQNKYLLDLTGNMNGSSAFGDKHRYAPVWSAGLGWNAHNEDFFKTAFPAISQFKLTATTGEAGSVAFPADLAKTIYTYQTANWYSTGVGATVNGYGNDNLDWQKTTIDQLTLELGLFNNKLTIKSDYYYKLTKGEIVQLTTAPSTGYLNYDANLGDVKNVGAEVYITFNAYKAKDININLTGTFVHNKNAVVHINNALKAYNESVNKYQADTANHAQTIPLLQYEEGRSINTIWGVKSKGIDPENGKEILVKRDGTLTYTYDAADIQPIGNMDAKGEGTFGSNITYKQFYLYFLFHYQFGGDYYNQTLVDRVEDADPRYNVDARALTQRWQKPGDVTFYKNIQDLSITHPTSRFVQKNNEIDLSSVTLSYDITKKLAKKIGLQSLRLSLTANDIFESSSIQIERGIYYPYARNLTCMLQATF